MLLCFFSRDSSVLLLNFLVIMIEYHHIKMYVRSFQNHYHHQSRDSCGRWGERMDTSTDNDLHIFVS